MENAESRKQLRLAADRLLRLRGYSVKTAQHLKSFRHGKIRGVTPQCFKQAVELPAEGREA